MVSIEMLFPGLSLTVISARLVINCSPYPKRIYTQTSLKRCFLYNCISYQLYFLSKSLQVHPVGRTCDVGLDIPGVALPDDFKKLSATLQRPRSKKEEPVNLELNPDNTLGMLYILFECWKLNVFYM